MCHQNQDEYSDIITSSELKKQKHFNIKIIPSRYVATSAFKSRREVDTDKMRHQLNTEIFAIIFEMLKKTRPYLKQGQNSIFQKL